MTPDRIREAAEPLSARERERYGRHLLLPEVGPAGQQRLKAASVVIVGAGGLGSPAALYLAAAGVGRLGLVDFDAVDRSNLHRQVLHGESALGRSKLDSARARLQDLNPDIAIETHDARLTSANALEILQGYDFVVDGSDNFPTRYLVNDACVLLGKPDIHATIHRFEGQVTVFDAARGPCYRCVFPAPPPPGVAPTCAEAGVLGVLPGVIGAIQATEAVKLILGEGDPLIGRLLVFDALAMRFQELRLAKDPDCAVCGPAPTVQALIDYDAFCGAPETAGSDDDITVEALAARRNTGDEVLLLDVREPHEFDYCRIAGSLHIPLRTLPNRLGDLDRERDIIVLCHHGERSALAARFLREQGFPRARNLAGGIHAWSVRVDPSVARY